MSMLQNFSGFLGKNDSVDFTGKYNEFLTAARSIRKQLGEQEHIFDKYLCDVFLAFNTITPNTAADDGFEVGAELNGIITDILTGENKEQEHPYYQTAKTYIEKHPMVQMNDMMKSIIYISALSADFFPQSVSSFTDRWTKVIQEEIGSDKGDFTKIYKSICAALGGGRQMDELNRLMCECFMKPSAIGIGFIMWKKEKIERVLGYIEDNLKNEITIEALANVAGYSKYHFLRLFNETVKLNAADYIRKR